MPKHFLFVTPLTPSRMLTPLRKALFEIFAASLKRQTYPSWEALMIGDEEGKDGNITYKKIKPESKELKLAFAKEYILSLDKKPDAVIRIDDDDVINPTLLQRISDLEFDCYADEYHSFFDVVSGKISQQRRTWIANTAVHKFEHAFISVGSNGLPLLLADHSKDWMNYYHQKNLIRAPKNQPVYTRVLSPTTVTSGLFENFTPEKALSDVYGEFMDKAALAQNAADYDLDRYKKYLAGFGKWKYANLGDLNGSVQDLETVWPSFSGEKRHENLITRLRKKWHT